MKYTTPDHVQFIDDMDAAGIAWEDYHGRFFWHGPAARTDESDGPTLQDVIRATTVTVQWDDMGRDYIVYPVTNSTGGTD